MTTTPVRIQNNIIKRELLSKWVKRGDSVLDVGCGQGGDIHKWKHLGISRLVGVDPNPVAIEEARRRSKGWSNGHYIVGDIRSAPLDHQFDVVCYNFSLQYQRLDLFPEITRRLKPHGILIGVVTDSTRINQGYLEGIQIERVGIDHIAVYIPDTPYYANGPVVEPVLHKNALITEAEKFGLRLQLWEPFSIYAKFVFVK